MTTAERTWIPTVEAAKRLGVSVRTLHRRVADESIVPAVRMPGKTGPMMFDPDYIDQVRSVGVSTAELPDTSGCPGGSATSRASLSEADQ